MAELITFGVDIKAVEKAFQELGQALSLHLIDAQKIHDAYVQALLNEINRKEQDYLSFEFNNLWEAITWQSQ